jgi:hypothetical protein
MVVVLSLFSALAQSTGDSTGLMAVGEASLAANYEPPPF